jgi:hypothetical protein
MGEGEQAEPAVQAEPEVQTEPWFNKWAAESPLLQEFSW